MYTPVHIQLKYFFYPIGNTPAVNLLRDQPPSPSRGEKINILSLGSGDPRNVFFTLWSDQNESTQRQLDFTFCDIEPAVLARNVVLYTLVHEQQRLNFTSSTIWNLFYHLYVPSKDASVLHDHLQSLIHLSETYDRWSASPYGVFIKFVDRQSLSHVREYWTRYLQFDDAVRARTHKAIVSQAKKMQDAIVFGGIRAAGPLWPELFKLFPGCYKGYWKTGVIAGNQEDVSQLGTLSPDKINPLFAISSASLGDFAVHYGTDPISGFHIAELGTMTGPKPSLDKFASYAKAQFEAWTSSFRRAIERKQITLRMFYGDALFFAHLLQQQQPSNATQKPIIERPSALRKTWSSETVRLDGDAIGDRFRIIDTSNLADHLGLINVIACAAPLLDDSRFAVLYTESLLIADEDMSKSVQILLGSDVATYSLLTGLVPSGLHSKVTTEAVGNETALWKVISKDDAPEQKRQNRNRLAWKPLSSADVAADHKGVPQVSFNSDDLVELLFGIYQKMFADETLDIEKRIQRMQLGASALDRPRYTRVALIALIRLVKSRISLDWDQAIRALLDRVEMDRSLILGTNNLQELYTHLHLSGVFSADTMKQRPERTRTRMFCGLTLRSPYEDKGFLAQGDLPPVVLLVLTVPRKRLHFFSKLDQMGTPALHISVRQEQGFAYENIFLALQTFFGKAKVDPTTHELIVEEDQNGWQGQQDLLVMTYVPSFGLLLGPKNGLKVGLRINNSPENIMLYLQKVGPMLTLHDVGFGDQSVTVCSGIQGSHHSHSRTLQEQWMDQEQARSRRQMQCKVQLSSNGVATHLQRRVDFRKDSDAARALVDGASVSVVQTSPSQLLLSIGDNVRQKLVYLLPILGPDHRIRIARKSSWVEVLCPIATHDPTSAAWTQMSFSPGTMPILREMSRIDFRIQPRISFSKNTKAAWVRTFMGSSTSDSERALNNATISSDNLYSGSVLLDLKQSFFNMIGHFAGLTESSPPSTKGAGTVFQLGLDGKDCHTIIFLTSVYHDLDLRSICMEGYVLPLTIPKIIKLKNALAELQSVKVPVHMIANTTEEVKLWKQALPAFAERCRDYSHKTSCEYLQPGATIPLSTEMPEDPICSCGAGKLSSQQFVKLGETQWAPFAPYVTRVALSPLFSVPWVETSMSHVGDKPKKSSPTDMKHTAQPSPSSRKPDTCANCGKRSKSLKTCDGCGKAQYCNRDCQKAAWKTHKIVCKKPS